MFRPHWRVLSLLLLWVWGASGCALLVFGAGAGGGAAGAGYMMGKLEEDVEAPVQKVQRATVAGLKDLDLPLVKETGDKLTAEIESRSADGKTVRIHIDSVSMSKSHVTIRVGWFGDEARSRRILEAIHRRIDAKERVPAARPST